MKKRTEEAGFTLAVTLVLLALIAAVVVAYLVSTRIERSTSSVYANRLRAKITAESGLAAATHLLSDNTRYGNYITAMPSPTASPLPPPTPTPARRTEIYRPAVSATDFTLSPTDYLRLDNAVGEVLCSRAVATTASPIPQVDPRPTPERIPTPPPTSPPPSQLTDPGFTNSNSYDFNQIVRVGTNDNARLVNSDNQPVFGQWVRVRNSAGELIGRYAFYIEDESMKVNVNVEGNNLASGSHLRVNDLAVPLPSPTPGSQVEEIYPATVLPSTSNGPAAISELAGIGNVGKRLPSEATTALLSQWNAGFSDYAHMITVLSKDDVTTSKGWQRLDLNKIVSDAEAVGTNQAKVDAAKKIANWMRDAWTGPRTLNDLKMDPTVQSYAAAYDGNDALALLYYDDRLRLQIAANIVDYIDVDDVPMDVGDVNPGSEFPNSAVPVLGIEKIPYLIQVDIVFQSTVQSASSAVVQMKFLFKFLNLFEKDLNLSDVIGKIRISGVPLISKNGQTVLNKRSTWFEIPVTSAPASGSISGTVPKGVDGQTDSGAKTFDTGFITSDTVSFVAGGQRTRLQAGMLEIEVLSQNGARIDVTRSSLRDLEAKWAQTGAANDFLTEGHQAASISGHWRDIPDDTVRELNDPRYRPGTLHFRWYNLTRTDEARVAALRDVAQVRPRTWAVDWTDSTQDRPLAVIPNRPLQNIGELGNISATQYPWRTLYLQYPERPPNTTIDTISNEVQLVRGKTVDYVLLDLFRAGTDVTRAGAININSQHNASASQGTIPALFLQAPVGSETLTSSAAVSTLSTVVSRRRVASGPPPDNTPLHPFFYAGDLASIISREVNRSDGTDTSGGRNRVTSTVLSSAQDYRLDAQVEQPFRDISNCITTRGNVFRVLYVGQATRDINSDGQVQSPQEVMAEYLGEAFIERQAKFELDPTINPDVMKTSDSTYKVMANRVITE